jgi:hypothetical protein
MHRITVYPLGNADTYRIDLAGGEKLLFDYAHVQCEDDVSDLRIDLPKVLREDLDDAGRDSYDVVAFTHLDQDHVHRASEFFEFWHAKKYQGGNRVKIDELWVPAYAITDDGLCDDGRIVRDEARYRLRQKRGIRVFSRPDALAGWLKTQGMTVDEVRHLITDAGQTVPDWNAESGKGVEFFVHSPFASRQNDGTLADRNSCSLVFQATFTADGVETKALLMADTPFDSLEEIVRISKRHENESRLEWDIVKLPHHCSYTSLGPDKGKEKTEPAEKVAWLYEEQGHPGAKIVSTSKPIPFNDDDQPPHRQAAKYYKDVLRDSYDGEFLVTMSHPSESAPKAMVLRIDGKKVTLERRIAVMGTGATSVTAPRAGGDATRRA